MENRVSWCHALGLAFQMNEILAEWVEMDSVGDAELIYYQCQFRESE
jgi:hypothetical protein